MSVITLPHDFKDGVDEVASGVQVMENLDALKSGIEARDEAGPYGARTERAFGAAIEPSSTEKVQVVGDVQLEPSAGFGAIAKIYIGGVEVQEIFAHEGIGHPIRLPFSFLVPAGEAYEVVNVSRAASLHTAHCPAP